MQFVKTSRKDMPGKDFEWQIIPGRSIALGKENVFDEITVKISGGIELRGSRCSINRAMVNFKPEEKLLKSSWTPSSAPYFHSIRLEFEPANSNIKLLGVGAQFAVDSNTNGSKFTAILRVSDEDGNRYEGENKEGQTINKMNNKAAFLGAEAGVGEIIRIARFDVVPELGSNIEGFYINSLRLLVG